jgi:hypothetical protein
MSDQRRPYARDAGLLVVAFVATFILLAGIVVAVNSRPPIDSAASGSPGPSQPSPAPASPTASPASSDADPSGDASPTVSSSSSSLEPPGEDPVLVGAGDIAHCSHEEDEATAKLLDDIPGTVFAAGDLAYGSGTERQFRDCYGPTWGRHLERTRPVPGNHDYDTDEGRPYREYFGDAALGPDDETWYSFDLGTWHIVMLDSNCSHVDCEEESDQVRWLIDDLAASDAECTAAIFHHPRFSSGFHGQDRDVAPFWDALYEAGADVVINGHDHDYERFAPQDPDANEDREAGLRQFVVGTGGVPLRDFEETAANSELRAIASHGVLKFTLRDGRYDWEFIATSGPFSDRGSAACH